MKQSVLHLMDLSGPDWTADRGLISNPKPLFLGCGCVISGCNVKPLRERCTVALVMTGSSLACPEKTTGRQLSEVPRFVQKCLICYVYE